MSKNKTNWGTFIAVASLIVAILAWLFGDDLIQRLFPRNNSSTVLRTPSTIPINAPNTTITAVPIGTNPLKSDNSTPVRIIIHTSTKRGIVGVSVRLNYIELFQDRLLVNLSFYNSNSSDVLWSCGLPKLMKSNYGEIAPILEKGGVYAQITARENCLHNDRLINVYEEQDGWLIYSVDTNRFQLTGLYTLYNLGIDFPTVTFEIYE